MALLTIAAALSWPNDLSCYYPFLKARARQLVYVQAVRLCTDSVMRLQSGTSLTLSAAMTVCAVGVLWNLRSAVLSGHALCRLQLVPHGKACFVSQGVGATSFVNHSKATLREESSPPAAWLLRAGYCEQILQTKAPLCSSRDM